MDSLPIKFHFHPKDFEKKKHAIEKDENGKKRRYLMGVSSGIQVDGHGERMTEKCIKSFHSQAQSGAVLLYEGQHGVNYIDDIGKLVHSEITGEGDWVTKFRLYDDEDKLGGVTIEKADKLWRQVTGLPPYDYPRQVGFSIEGEVPDGGIVSMDIGGKRVLDDVTLDGVLVVPRPAYKDSIATAVYKALGIPSPWKIKKNLTRTLQGNMDESERKDLYFRRKCQVDSALEEEIHDIMLGTFPDYREPLNMLFDEYRDLMVRLIIDSKDLFLEESSDAISGYAVYRASMSNAQDLFEKLRLVTKQLQGVHHAKLRGEEPVGKRKGSDIGN